MRTLQLVLVLWVLGLGCGDTGTNGSDGNNGTNAAEDTDASDEMVPGEGLYGLTRPVTFIVYDSESEMPIADAGITLDGKSVTTDATGRVQFKLGWGEEYDP